MKKLFGEKYLLNMQKKSDEIYSIPSARNGTFSLAFPSESIVLHESIDHHTYMPVIKTLILASTRTSKDLHIPEYYWYCFLLLTDKGKVNKERIVTRSRSLNGVATPLTNTLCRIFQHNEPPAENGASPADGEVSDDKDEDENDCMTVAW